MGALKSWMRRTAKTVAIGTLAQIGTIYPASGVPIFCYHSIDDSNCAFSVTPSLFEKQMELLKKDGFHTMSLSRLCELIVQRQPLPSRTAVVTFDDGFRNNHSVALPILRRFGFTATIFVVTGCVGQRMNWKKTIPVPDLEMMSWDELAEMSEAGFDIQSHTVTHPFLNELTPQAAKTEILESKTDIELHIGRPVTLLAYPYGAYTPQIAQLVREIGFLGAVTVDFGMTRSDDSRFELKRVHVADIGNVSDKVKLMHFKACLSGTAAWYHRLKLCLPMFVDWPHPPESVDSRQNRAVSRSAGGITGSPEDGV